MAYPAISGVDDPRYLRAALIRGEQIISAPMSVVDRMSTIISVRDYGAHPDNSDNTIAFAAAKAAAIASGSRSTIYIPYGDYRFSSGSAIDDTNGYGLRYFGDGSPNTPINNVAASNLIATSNSFSLVKLQGSKAFSFDCIHFTYADNSYTNDLVDLRQGAGSGLTANISFDKCRLGGHSVNAKNAGSLVRLGDTLDISINRCAFNYAEIGLLGGGAGEAVNDVIVDGCWFDGGYNTVAVKLGGQSWNMSNNIFEPRVSDGAAVAVQTTALGMIGLTYINNRHDDGATTGTWFDVNSGVILGGFFAGNFFRNGARSMSLGASKDLAIIGNAFYCQESTPAINPGTAINLTALSNYIMTDTGLNIPGLFSTSPTAGNGSFWDNRDGSGLKTTGPIAMGNRMRLAAATTSFASQNMLAGTAPSSPVNGDMWFDGTDVKVRIGGVTKTFTVT